MGLNKGYRKVDQMNLRNVGKSEVLNFTGVDVESTSGSSVDLSLYFLNVRDGLYCFIQGRNLTAPQA